MSVKSTQLHGMRSQIQSWTDAIPEMDGYTEEDYNSLYELYCALEEAENQIGYALREDEGNSPIVV